MSGLLTRVDTMLGIYESRGNTNVPGTYSLIRDLAAALQDGLATSSEPSSGRNFFKDAGELEAIVRDLAGRDPILSVGGQEYDDYVCSLCPDDWYEQEPFFERAEDVKHSPQCAWSLAVAWVAAHPVSGTETTDG